ncbi:MAG: hypothetical protein HY332_21470 [Chloroflexi bacterium]|nr:hypothetical protein [Chloroflexota bacterium]
MEPHRTWIAVELGTEARPALVRWATFYPRDEQKTRGGIYVAYALATDQGPVVVDPCRPAAHADQVLRDRLRAMGGVPIASVLTNDMHERDAYALRRTYGVPVWASAAGVPDYDGTPDRLFEDGAALPGGLRAITIEGPFPGDTCLLWTAPEGTRVLFTGDMVMGGAFDEDPRVDVTLREPGLYLHGVNSHPRGSKDMAAFKASLRRLLDEEFDLVCPAHGRPYGRPYGANPKAALARLLE